MRALRAATYDHSSMLAVCLKGLFSHAYGFQDAYTAAITSTLRRAIIRRGCSHVFVNSNGFQMVLKVILRSLYLYSFFAPIAYV